MKQLLGSRKFWSGVAAFIAINVTFLLTHSEMLAGLASAGFIGNVYAVWKQNMRTEESTKELRTSGKQQYNGNPGQGED